MRAAVARQLERTEPYLHPCGVSVSIQAHRSRERFIPYLQKHLGPVPVAWSKAKNPMDTRQRDVWDTRKRAMQMLDPEARFHLVVQDDALIGARFYDRLAAMLERHGEVAYSLYHRQKHRKPRFVEASRDAKGLGGMFWPRLLFGVATVLPVAIIADLIAYCDELTMPTPGGQDDVRMSRYLEAKEIPVFYPLPSLVDHRPEVRGFHGPNSYRRAWSFE